MPFRSFFLRSAISHRISGFTLSHLSGINSWRWGLFGIFVSTSLSHAHGSTKLFLQLAISDVSTAARCPACWLPTNNQFLRPMAIGRIARSAKLLSVSMWVMMPVIFTYAMSSGLALSALYWLPMQLSHTRKLFRQPGHWLLGCFLIVSIGGIANWACLIGYDRSLTFDGTVAIIPSIGFLVTTISCLCGAILSGVAAFKAQIRWRVAMIFLVVYFTTNVINYAIFTLALLGFNSGFYFAISCQPIEQIAGVSAGIATLVAVCIDLARKPHRDWLHWIGVVVVVLNLLLSPLLLLAITYFVPL